LCFDLFQKTEIKKKSGSSIVDKQLGYIDIAVKKDNIPTIEKASLSFPFQDSGAKEFPNLPSIAFRIYHSTIYLRDLT
jgi:hypothetical protein